MLLPRQKQVSHDDVHGGYVGLYIDDPQLNTVVLTNLNILGQYLEDRPDKLWQSQHQWNVGIELSQTCLS
jgi:hypothetical protein